MSEMTQAYRRWIMEQQIEGCTMEEDEQGNITLQSDLVRGWVNFYDIDGSVIVELRLERVVDSDPLFFLHFELEDLDRAEKLFGEMAEVFYDATHRKVKHVLLCCTCGVTTTYFSNKLNELAQAFGVDYDFDAKSIENAKQSGYEYVAVLLAPQVGHMRRSVVEALPQGIPVIEIPAKVFGAYDAAGALKLVVDTLSGVRVADASETLSPVRDYDRTKRVLALSYIYREDEPTLSYRVLDCGEIAAAGMLVRRSFDVSAIDDLAATLRVQGWKTSDFDAVGLAVPGIVEKGRLVETRKGVRVDWPLAETLSEMWGTKVYVDFYATAAAAGCYVSQDEYENVAFHSQAVGVAEAEQGYVLSGAELVGAGGRSGHLGPLASSFSLGMSLDDAAWRVRGLVKLVSSYLKGTICTLSPEVIYVWCDLIPDMEDLRHELAKSLPDEAIPELRAVADCDACVLTGELALCLRRIANEG